MANPVASETAQSALVKSSLALDRIERHEETCGRRWGHVLRLIWLMLVKLSALLSFLLADKLGWAG
ncbi:hypothetical protein [Yunchengibacter salinarum]|uniref:hypothetical protein n=1 Tax=Yunchengibacter salinarum TaxID=3133399 RepID=UPI0035B5ED39